MLYTLVESCAHCGAELQRTLDVTSDVRAILETAAKDITANVRFQWIEQEQKGGNDE